MLESESMTIDFEVLRREYLQKALNEEDMNSDPVKQFDDWFQTAVNFDFDLPNAGSWEQLEDYIKDKYPDTTSNMINSAKSIWQHYADSAERNRA